MSDEILIHDENDLKTKIHTIRGMQVMLDFDLAEIYGYDTRSFNKQVTNNIERFDEDFRFQLTKEEFDDLILMCKIYTSSWGGTRKLPYAFTEQGIYMLMTVLRGELAVKQSKALVRIFKQMKDFILQSQNILSGSELTKLSLQTSDNTKQISDNTKEIKDIKDNMVTKTELTKVMKDFTDPNIKKDYLFLNGETVEADIAYSTIYSSAKKTFFIIDNYINLKTLVLLKFVKPTVQITLFSDNVGKGLHKTEYNDFCKEYPNVHLTLKMTKGIYHDRYIFIDFGTKNAKIFHCGGSSKDAGARTTAISQVEDMKLYQKIAIDLQKIPPLVL